jgi:tripartite-type tricarboxylate transporter receptor subunit TctC
LSSRRTLIGAALALLMAASAPGFAQAPAYPAKPVTIIVNYGAGGANDITTRKLASSMEKRWKQPVVVENHPGAGGVIGLAKLAKATPDGYTLGTVSYTPLMVVPQLRDVPYDPAKDFTYIAQFAEYIGVLCVRNDSPFKSLADLVEHARANPGKLTYGTTGAGSGQHIYMESFARRAGIQLVHVPGSGGSQGIATLLGGHIEAVLDPTFARLAKSGECRALAVMGDRRHAALPDAPSFKEAGFDIFIPFWLGLAGPPGMRPEIVASIEAGVLAAAGDREFLDFLDANMLSPTSRGSREFVAKFPEEAERVASQMKSAGFTRQ